MARHTTTRSSSSSQSELAGLIARVRGFTAAALSSQVLARRIVALILGIRSTRSQAALEAGIVERRRQPIVFRTPDLRMSAGESARTTTTTRRSYPPASATKPRIRVA